MSNVLRQHFPRFGRLANHVLFINIERDSDDDDDDHDDDDSYDDGNGLGSGVLLTDHLAVTANHVVDGATTLTAYATRFQEHRPYLRSAKRGTVVKVLWRDAVHDLAVIKLRRTINATPANFAAVPTLDIDQAVLRLGYDDYRLGVGYIHGFEIVDTATRFKASLQAGPGTSGGPLFDFHSGELVGIVTHAHDDEDMPPAAHGMPLRTLFTLLAAQAPDLHKRILTRAIR